MAATLSDREYEAIELLTARGESARYIAKIIGRPFQSVYQWQKYGGKSKVKTGFVKEK